MVYGVKCQACGLMQLSRPSCKACGAVLQGFPEVPSRAPSKVPSEDRAPRRAVTRTMGVTGTVGTAEMIATAGTAEASRCDECGMEFREDELIRFGQALVCAGCKPIYVQRLREGVTVAGEMVYAGFWIRVGAKIIDGLILGAAGFGLGFLGSLIIRHTLAGAVLQNTLYWLLGIAYGTYFLGAHSATPGKMACGLKVVRPDGQKITYGRACGRSFAEFVSSIILGIGYLMAGFDEEKRALHDRICDTRVIQT